MKSARVIMRRSCLLWRSMLSKTALSKNVIFYPDYYIFIEGSRLRDYHTTIRIASNNTQDLQEVMLCLITMN